MKSRFFHTDRYVSARDRIKAFLNVQERFLSGSTARSTRAVGDAIQEVLSNDFRSIGRDVCVNYSSQFARRAMADMAFEDPDGAYTEEDARLICHEYGTIIQASRGFRQADPSAGSVAPRGRRRCWSLRARQPIFRAFRNRRAWSRDRISMGENRLGARDLRKERPAGRIDVSAVTCRAR